MKTILDAITNEIGARDDWFVKCPTCPLDEGTSVLTHLVSVAVLAGENVTHITSNGVAQMKRDTVPERGVVTRHVFMCESLGHEFTLETQFHKGSTEIRIKQGRNYEEVDDHDRPYVIWRD